MSLSPSANFNSSGSKEHTSYEHEHSSLNDYTLINSSVGKSNYAGGSFNMQYQYNPNSNIGVFFTYGYRKKDNEFNTVEINRSKDVIGFNTYDAKIPKIFASTYWESKLGKKGGRTWMELTYSNLNDKSNTDYCGNYVNEDKYFFTYADNDQIKENAQNNTFYGLTLNYYYDKIRWLIFSASADYGYSKYSSNLDGISSTADGSDWFVSAYVDFTFNKKRTVTGYLSGSYQGKRNTAVSVIDPQYETSVGVSCFMLKRRLSISCSGLNLFASKYTGTSKRNGYRIMFDNRYNYPTLYFSVSYRFSTKAKDVSQSRRISTRDVESRF